MINKKAETNIFLIFTFIVSAVLVLFLFAGIIYISGLLNTEFHNIGVRNEQSGGIGANLTEASDVVFGSLYSMAGTLRLVSFVYIMGIACIIILTGFYERKHPILFFAYVLIIVLAIITSVPISNYYEDILSQGIMGGELSTFTLSNFIMAKLPLVVMIIGFLGGIGLFINLVRGDSYGGGGL